MPLVPRLVLTAVFQFFTEAPIAIESSGIGADDKDGKPGQDYYVFKFLLGSVFQIVMVLVATLLEGTQLTGDNRTWFLSLIAGMLVVKALTFGAVGKHSWVMQFGDRTVHDLLWGENSYVPFMIRLILGTIFAYVGLGMMIEVAVEDYAAHPMWATGIVVLIVAGPVLQALMACGRRPHGDLCDFVEHNCKMRP